MVHNFDMDDVLQLYFVTFANVFYFLGCGINPLIYIFRCARFKNEATRLVYSLLSYIVCCKGDLRTTIMERGRHFSESFELNWNNKWEGKRVEKKSPRVEKK